MSPLKGPPAAPRQLLPLYVEAEEEEVVRPIVAFQRGRVHLAISQVEPFERQPDSHRITPVVLGSDAKARLPVDREGRRPIAVIQRGAVIDKARLEQPFVAQAIVQADATPPRVLELEWDGVGFSWT